MKDKDCRAWCARLSPVWLLVCLIRTDIITKVHYFRDFVNIKLLRWAGDRPIFFKAKTCAFVP